MKNPIVHFEIPADDPKRASDFYTKVFDWKITEYEMPGDGATSGDPYYMVYTTELDENGRTKTPGALNGGLMKRNKHQLPFMNYIHTDSIEQSLMAVSENGGSVIMEKTEIGPNMGFIAAFKDTEGNIMGLHEMPEGKKDEAAS